MSAARRSLQVVAFICTLIVGAASMAVIVTQTTWFKEWLRGFIVRQAQGYMNGRLSIGRLDGNLFFGVELEDIDVTMNGKKVVEVKDVGLDYNAFTFIGGHVVLDDIRLNQPTIRLERTADGWNITELIKAQTPDPDEPKTRRPIEIGEIGITDGSVEFADQAVGTTGVSIPERIEKLNASIGVTSDEDVLHVDIGHVSLRGQEPRIGINDLSGQIIRTENQLRFENVSLRTEESSLQIKGTVNNIEGSAPAVDVTASSDKLDIEEIGRLVPALRGYRLQPAFEVTAKGPADRLEVDLNAREQNLGNMVGDLTVDAMEPTRRVAGLVKMEHFNLGPVARSETLKSDITGQARVDLALPSGRMPLSGTYSIDASRAQVAGYEVRDLRAKGRIDGQKIRLNANAAAYGGRATVNGTVTTGTPLALNLEGRATNLDLRNLPPQLNAPGVPSDLDVDYRIQGRGRVFSGDVTMHSSTLAGASIAPGTVASFTIGNGAPTYSSQGTVSDLDIQQVGRGFGITALREDRFKSRINATYSLKGSGGGSRPLTLEASGTLTDSELFGAHLPRMDFGANIAGDDMQVRALGQLSNLNPATITGNERAKGDISGAVDVNAAIRNYRGGVTVDSIDARGRVNLGRSTIAGLSIETAVIDGAYANREGQINQVTITGPDINLQGQGKLVLNDTGASDMQLHLDTPALAEIGELIGQPLKGAAALDAKLTGNAQQLQAAGTLKGSNIGHGENEALNLVSTFTVLVPDLTPGQASIKADTHATFLEVGGQRITELTAKTTYDQKQLQFDALAQEGVRELGAAGSVVFHTDHQEIHLGNLALRTEGIEWRSAPGSDTAIQYGKDRIAINNLQLMNADQRIEASGVIGSSSEPLKVQLQNVDVAQVDELLLTNQGIAGRLNASATVAGPTDALRVDGKFDLTGGAFREFKFDSLGGTVAYSGKGVNVDVRLQQNPQAWLTATGYVPMALFEASGDREGGHRPPAPGEEVNVQVATSTIDLGVIQGFTTYVTNVTGILQANIKVTGSAHDPHMEGAIDIRGGALTIPDMGTAYTGIDTRVDLSPDAVSIKEMRIVDEHQNVMTIGGTLGVHERAVGAVDITIQSEDFEVIDNDLADLKLDTNLRVTGETRAPRVEGLVEVETGTINVQQVLEQTTSDPYATEAATIEPRSEGPEAPETPTLFNGLDLNMAVSIPSNLVLRGSDLQPANAPISIGDINVTVGGLMQLRKPRGTNDLRLTGEVNTVRGNYEFQGRQFELMRDGRIRFAGADEINPLLDLRARRVISGVETFVQVRGTMREPELSFSSSPPLPEADILSLIVFNMPINELGEGQQISLAERAGALAGGYLAAGLAKSIGNALELDEFEIQAQSENGGGPTLTVGEQVGEKLFFRVRQGFGEAQATEFILEYQIADYLRVQGSVAETAGGTQRAMFRRVERGGLDLVFFFSY
jgi:autotransporter translocation and assembly factor TamB